MNAETFLSVLEEEKRKLEEENTSLKREAESFKHEAGSLREKVDLLQEQVNDLLRRVYGRRSERFVDPNQRDLFEEILTLTEELREKAEERPEEREKIEYERKRPEKRGPKPLPEHLERKRVPLDPSEEERTCACCRKAMERIDEVVTEELDIEPPRFKVIQYVRGKYRCRECMNRDVVVALPPRPIERGRPSPSLLAYLIVSKYGDHIPLYRQQQIFKRHGIHLARSTMDEWLGQISGLLQAIVEALKRSLLEKDYLQVDESPIQALDRRLKGKTRRCYVWAYCRPGGDVVYDVTESRSGKNPRRFLGSFSGHLQTDGFAGYNALWRRDLRQVACMAHIRRKFLEGKHSAPEEVERILRVIRLLYRMEGRARRENFSREARLELRRGRSKRLLSMLERLIGDLGPRALPQSKLGGAVKYAQGQWQAMLRYVDVRDAEIDNNSCENTLRPVVLGRKNFLFLGSPKAGGERAEVFYSLVQSCRRLDIDPFRYLKDVIARVSTHSASRIWELTPRGWKEALEKAEKVSTSSAR